MELKQLTKEEYENYNPDDFLGKFTFVNLMPGAGKTKKIVELVFSYVSQEMRVLVVMPTHKKISEFFNESESLPELVWLKGKEQPGMCDGTNDDKLNNCNKTCSAYPCKYKKQFKLLHSTNLFFCVPDHLVLIDKIKPDVLIFDESPENWIYKTIEIPTMVRSKVIPSDIPCINCPVSNLCPTKKKNKRTRFSDPCIIDLQGLKSIKIDSLKVSTLQEKFFKDTVENIKKIYGIYDDGLKLIGRNDFELKVHTLILNCATTKCSQAVAFFKKDIDVLIQDKITLENKIYVLTDMMTISKTKKEIPNLKSYLEFFKIPIDDSLLIYTKKKFEHEIRKMLPDVNIGHFGDSRGYNKFKKCKNVVIFGRFSLRVSHQWLLFLQGVKFEDSEWLGAAEELQALHRIRPILDKDKNIYLFSNSLIGVVDGFEFSRISLTIALEMFGFFEGLSKTEIYNELKHHHNKDVKKALELLHELGYINDMNKRSEKLKWL